MSDRSTETGTTSSASAAPSLSAAVLGLVRSLAGVLGAALHLAALETRLAGLSLAAMLALAVAGALLLATAWLLTVAAVAVFLVRLGLAWELALLLAAGLNVALALPMITAIRRLSRNLLFSATRGQLHPEAPPEPPVSPPGGGNPLG